MKFLFKSQYQKLAILIIVVATFFISHKVFAFEYYQLNDSVQTTYTTVTSPKNLQTVSFPTSTQIKYLKIKAGIVSGGPSWSFRIGSDNQCFWSYSQFVAIGNYLVSTSTSNCPVRTAGNHQVAFLAGNTGSTYYFNGASSTSAYIYMNDVGFDLPSSTSTQIISFSPENGTTTQNPVKFDLLAYVSPDDIGQYIGIQFTLHNIDQNVFLASALSPSDIYFLDGFEATSSGYFYFSSTTSIGEGNYRINAYLERSYLSGFFLNPFSSVNQDLSHTFIVGTSTYIGTLTQNSWIMMNDLFSSSTATTTAGYGQSCRPFSGEFNVISCLGDLFVPSTAKIEESFNLFKDNALTHFPVGYLTDFVSIISTSSQISIPVLSATVPQGVAGAGASVFLDLSHSIDWLLNSTSTFITTGSNVGKSFYEMTSYYWNLIVYIALAFYLLSRILGSHLIGISFNEGKKLLNKKL